MTSCMPFDYSVYDYIQFYLVSRCENVFCDKIQVFIIQIVYACYRVDVEKMLQNFHFHVGYISLETTVHCED